MVDDIQGLSKILKECKTIAMVGLSQKWNRPSNYAAKYLILHGYEVIPVTPTYEQVLGQKCYNSILDIPKKVDVVDCFRKVEEIPLIARDAVKIGAKVLWMQLGIVNEEARKIAEDAGLEVVMNRCMKIEHGRIFGGISFLGVNTSVITSRKQ